MLAIDQFKYFIGAFSWFTSLGKADADHIKEEIEDLLSHSSQSLRTLLELSDTLRDIPAAQFTKEFWPIANHCLLVFTGPEAANKARTHCTDIERDLNRINFKMAKVLRTESGDWKGIDRAFAMLVNADFTFLDNFEAELRRIGTDLDEVGKLVKNGDTTAAMQKYNELRDSLLCSRRDLSNEIAAMRRAQVHIHALLT